MPDDKSLQNLSRVSSRAANALLTSGLKKVCIGVSWDSTLFVISFFLGSLFVGVVTVSLVMSLLLVIDGDGGTSGAV